MILLVDNYDSFTWNLYQYLGELGSQLRVVRNDELSVDEVLELAPGQPVAEQQAAQVRRKLGQER